MSNAILTPTAVTREALRILHQKLNFVGSINRQHDDSFAKRGARIGDSLKIRLPNKYVVRTGATLSAQDTTETSVTLQVATQKGVDLNFTSVDLTLSLDDFSKRILEPAMAVLAADIEADALSMYKDVYHAVGTPGSAGSFAMALAARKKLQDRLAPAGERSICLDTQLNVDLVDALKGLFHDGQAVGQQYREGLIGWTAGFDWMENTLLPRHSVGTKAGTPLVNGADQVGASLVTDGWSNSSAILKRGDVFTIAGVFAIHPETRESTGVLQQFAVTADISSSGAGAATIAISPAIDVAGADQTVSGSPADNAAINVVGTASTAHDVSLAFHKDAFAFATADLVMPSGVDFARREVLDGVSMRIVRQYDINNDKFPCRLDVLYGYKTLRAEHACRIQTN